MKNKIILFAFFLLFFCFSSGQIWDYPIKPGTEKWKQLKSNKEKVDACQIPDSVLQTISTNDLMILYLQYPLLYDIFAFQNINVGLEKFLMVLESLSQEKML